MLSEVKIVDFFSKEACNNLSDFVKKIEDKINEGWVFRGQRIETWSLEHKFERACKRFFIPKTKRERIERNMIREFKRRLHQYSENIPKTTDTDEWIALMQHYGAPTRLLDFTYSPYVAAYFAFEFAQSDQNVAIWAIKNGWFTEQFKDIKNISEELFKKYRDYLDNREKHGKNFSTIFMPKKPHNFLLTVNPFRLNERLAYQRGVFLCPGNVSVSLIENLSEYKSDELCKHIVKYIIPTSHNNKNTIEALEILDSMNINRITLFPGLDGFAQSLEPRIKSLFVKQYRH